jgi:hypothetical protein
MLRGEQTLFFELKMLSVDVLFYAVFQRASKDYEFVEIVGTFSNVLSFIRKRKVGSESGT